MVKQICLGMVLIFATHLSFADQDPTTPLDWAHPVKAPTTKTHSTHKSRQHHQRLPRLDSIMCQTGREACYAILNDHIVSNGQRYHGYDVVEINKEFVTLKRGNRHWKLELFRLDIKK